MTKLITTVVLVMVLIISVINLILVIKNYKETSEMYKRETDEWMRGEG